MYSDFYPVKRFESDLDVQVQFSSGQSGHSDWVDSWLMMLEGIIHTVELLIWMIQLALLEKYHRLTKNSVLD